MGLEYRPFSVALDRSLSTADGEIEAREGFLVRTGGAPGDHAPASSDAAGIGEATPLPGFTEDGETCERALAAAAEAFDREGAAAAIDAAAGAPAARHGVALAVADREAKRAGEPLYRHLRGETAIDGDPNGTVETVPVNATVGDAPVGETVAAAEAAVEEGFPAVKVKVGARRVGEDVARLSAVGDAVGDAQLRADANGTWTRVQATEALRGLSGAGVDLVEQPLAADDLDGLAGLRGGRVRIAVDETLAATPPERVIESGVADVLVCKPMALGGPDRALAAAARAREAGLAALVTTTIDAVVARTAAVHCAAAIPEVPACGLATADRLADDLAPDPAPVADGSIRVPQGSGLDVTDAWEGIA